MTKEEFRSLVERYGDKIFAFCCYLTGSRQEAEDLYQDTMLKGTEKSALLKSGNTEENMKKAANYLCGIAVKLNKNMLKRQKVMNEHLVYSEEGIAEVPAVSDPEENAVKEETKLQLQKALDMLEPHYRSVILMHYYMDMKYEEIAKSLHIPTGTVRSRINKAKKIMHAYIESMDGKGR